MRLIRTASGLALVRTLRGPEGERIRVLQQGGVFQSATYVGQRRFEPVFSYIRAFDLAFEAVPGARRALMLGGGGFSWPKHVLTARDRVSIDVIEIDPAVVDAAKRYFYVDELLADPATAGRLDVACVDGRAFLDGSARGPSPLYDVIVNDTFAGAEPVRSLVTVEAARSVRACLDGDGIYLANVVSRDGGVDVSFLRDEVATLLEVFSHVHVVPVEDDELAGEDNYIVAATDGSWVPAGSVPFDAGFPGSVLRDAL